MLVLGIVWNDWLFVFQWDVNVNVFGGKTIEIMYLLNGKWDNVDLCIWYIISRSRFGSSDIFTNNIYALIEVLDLQLRTKIPNNKINILKFLSIININPIKKLHMDEFIYFKKKNPSMSKQIREWVREIAEILICPKQSL